MGDQQQTPEEFGKQQVNSLPSSIPAGQPSGLWEDHDYKEIESRNSTPSDSAFADGIWDDHRCQVDNVPNQSAKSGGCGGVAIGFMAGLVISILCFYALFQISGGDIFIGVIVMVLLNVAFIFACYLDGRTAVASGVIAQMVFFLLLYGLFIMMMISRLHSRFSSL